jgi:hypothetical protein
MTIRQTIAVSADDSVRQILARKEEALAYLRQATRAGKAEDIEAWQSLIRKFDRQLAQYGRTWN